MAFINDFTVNYAEFVTRLSGLTDHLSFLTAIIHVDRDVFKKVILKTNSPEYLPMSA